MFVVIVVVAFYWGAWIFRVLWTLRVLHFVLVLAMNAEFQNHMFITWMQEYADFPIPLPASLHKLLNLISTFLESIIFPIARQEAEPIEAPAPVKFQTDNLSTNFLPIACLITTTDAIPIWIRQDDSRITAHVCYAACDNGKVALEGQEPTRGRINGETDVAEDGEEAFFGEEKGGFGADRNLHLEDADYRTPFYGVAAAL